MGVTVATTSQGFALATTKGSGKMPSTENSVGIYLPEFTTDGRSLSDFTEEFLGARICKSAKKLLKSISSTGFASAKGVKRELIMAQGLSIGKRHPSNDDIRKFASVKTWVKPSAEDALYQVRVIPIATLKRSQFGSILFMHEPVNGCVLGVTSDEGGKVLTAYPVDSPEGLFLDYSAVAFRPPYPTVY